MDFVPIKPKRKESQPDFEGDSPDTPSSNGQSHKNISAIMLLASMDTSPVLPFRRKSSEQQDRNNIVTTKSFKNLLRKGLHH